MFWQQFKSAADGREKTRDERTFNQLCDNQVRSYKNLTDLSGIESKTMSSLDNTLFRKLCDRVRQTQEDKPRKLNITSEYDDGE